MAAGISAGAKSASARTASVAGLAAGLVTVVLWGSAFVAIRAADVRLSPGAIALGRLVVATTILSAVAVVRREPMPSRRDLMAIAGYGVLWLGVYSVTLNAAERYVSAGTSAMIVNIGPLLIAVLAGFFLGEGFPRGLIGGCVTAFFGCVLIGLASIGSSAGSGPGIGLCVVAAIAYACAVIVQKPVLVRVSPFMVAWLGCAAATIVCLPFAPALVTGVAASSPGVIGWTIYLGAGPTALGFGTWAIALRKGSAGRAGALNYLIPVVAIVLGWAVLSQRPQWLAVAGGVVCLFGVYLGRARPRDAASPVSSPEASVSAEVKAGSETRDGAQTGRSAR